MAGSGCRWVRGQSFKLTGIEAQADGMSFQPDVADPRAAEEGLPCLINHVRCPTSPACGTEPISAGPGQASLALSQARWVISRFGEAGTPGWTAPGDGELGEHFDAQFLRLVPPETLVSTLAGAAPGLRAELVTTLETPLRLRGQIGGLQLEAVVSADPPHRLTGLRLFPLGERVTDPRVAAPSTRASGEVPAAAAAVAEESFAGLGLPGLVLAGAPAGARAGDGSGWVAARGWASLDGASHDGCVPLTPGHRFPAYSVTKLITATVVLRLAADGQIGLDDPAAAHLRTVRPADETVTVRDLLTHTAGVQNPAEMFADHVPDLVTLVGPVVASAGPRGTFSYSNGGYGLLGQLIADVPGGTYPEAATQMVLGPLGMSCSWFPASWPATGAVTGYHLGGDGSFETAPARICTGTGAAGGPGAASSLIVRLGTGQPSVALANRRVPIEPVNARLVRPAA